MDPVWIPFVSAVTGSVLGALGVMLGQWLSQKLVTIRESQLREKKQASERALIGSRLIILLADYEDRCRDFSQNPGEDHVMTNPLPDIIRFDSADGDWSTLNGNILLRIQSLPLLHRQYERNFSEIFDKLGVAEYLQAAEDCFRKQADECVSLINELMILCDLPSPWESADD